MLYCGLKFQVQEKISHLAELIDVDEFRVQVL
jgi:hypothetical protein